MSMVFGWKTEACIASTPGSREYIHPGYEIGGIEKSFDVAVPRTTIKIKNGTTL